MAHSHGFSNVNYALYGFILIEYIFSLLSFVYSYVKKNKGDLFEIIFGAIIVGLIILAFFFDGGTTGFSFASYPYDLMQDVHWPGLLIGVMTAVFLKIEYVTVSRGRTSP